MQNTMRNGQNKKELSGFRRHIFLAEILACPACKGAVRLDRNTNLITCLKCKKKYPIVNDIPIMIEEQDNKKVNMDLKSDNDSQRMVRNFTQKHSILERLHRAVQPPRQPYFGTRKEVKIAQLIDVARKNCAAAEIGSGSTRTDQRLVNVDIFSFPNVDVVGIGGKLPFLDNSLSVIASQAVLEHVPNPWLTVNEMYRVLKPGGYLYAEVPGVVPYHGFPAHYQNFTREGLKELFHEFELVEQGVVFGPSSALVWLIKDYCGLFFSNFYLRVIVHTIVEWLLHPLNYLDFFLQKAPNAHRMAMTLYFIGRKSM
jgi:uncharacterized protein YbaR (Trm112 family)